MLFRRVVLAAVVLGGLGLTACSAPAVNSGAVSNASGAAAPAKETAKAPTWGQRYTWTDGLAVEVSKPEACKPSSAASPQGIKRAVKFKITVVNGTDKPYDAGTLGVGMDAQFASAKAEAVFDSGGACGDGALTDNATVLPGKSYTMEQAFSVGASAGELQLTLQPDIMADKAAFIGQV